MINWQRILLQFVTGSIVVVIALMLILGKDWWQMVFLWVVCTLGIAGTVLLATAWVIGYLIVTIVESALGRPAST